MSRTVWKFPLRAMGAQVVSLPRGARVLAVQEQGGVPMLWALVDPDALPVERVVYVAMTGHPLPDSIDDVSFVGTVQIGMLVFHAFIEEEPKQ